MLPHDHGRPKFGRGGGVDVLVVVGGGGVGHQHRRGAAHRQLAEGAGAAAADRQGGVLQQARDLVAEGKLHYPCRQGQACLGVVVAGEVHHPHASGRELGKQGAHHLVETHGSLATAHHQQQGPGAFGRPVGQGGGLQKGLPHRRSRHHGAAAGQAGSGLGQAHRHLAAEPAQQAGHLAGHSVALMQHHRHAGPAGRQDCGRRDVAAAGKNRCDAFAPDQPPH